MSKLTHVSLMVASALYAGAGAASGGNGTDAPLWNAPPADYAPQPISMPEYAGIPNQQIKKQHRIFTPEQDISGTQTYIVQLEDMPAAVYDGSLQQFPATNTQVQRQLMGNKPLAVNEGTLGQYTRYLGQKREQLLSNALTQQGLNIQVEQTFAMTLNGFSTSMTQDEAMRLAKVPGIKHISRAKTRQLFTHNTTRQTGADQVWTNASSGLASNMGEGMIVGIIDTGINTDHPSFAAVGGDGYRHINPLGDKYLGDCATFEGLCNDKLIGVYSFPEVTEAYSDPVFAETRPPVGEDYHSHGSHVAGTAAGNVIKNQPFVIAEGKPQSEGIETSFVFPQVSGMAPHANIISYQVCLPGGSGDPYAGCPEVAILKAVEQSVIDNVDVINLSLGGIEENPWLDPMEQAFLHAAKSGIFVVTAAGNSGDRLYTADHSSPWLTNVGAHTPSAVPEYQDKYLQDMRGGATVAPETMSGRSLTFDEISGVIVRAQDFPNPNETSASTWANCDKPYPAGTFDLADNPDTPDLDESQEKVIVLCKRSSRPLYAKSQNVAAGGAEGIIIQNQSPYQDNSVTPDVPHVIPGIHISHANGQKLSTWLSTGAGHFGTITGTEMELVPVEKETMAGFSSRGPSYFGIDTMVVDIAAPGVDIFAPASDDQPFTKNPSAGLWTTMSGTSMASPHVAGAATLLRQSHPDWSPMQVQSALMMTATNQLENGSIINPYTSYQELSGYQDMGAGRMNVDMADKVDLTLHEDMEALALANPGNGGDVKKLNTAYMVDTDCGDSCSFMRTFTAERDGHWTLSTEAFLDGYDIKVQPESFSLKAGETQSIVVSVVNRQTSSAVDRVSLSGNQGQVLVTSSNPDAPVLELPVWTWVGAKGIPTHVMVDAHRTSGQMEVGPFDTAEVNELTTRSYGLVKAAQHSVHLYTDTTGGDPFDLDAEGKFNNHLTLTNVPDNTQALFSRVVGDDHSRVLVFMGEDSNQNGMPDPEEMLCMSTSYTEANYCSIQQPNAGTYWTVYMSLAVLNYGQEDLGREITVAEAVVPAVDTGNLVISGESSIPGYRSYPLNLSYRIPELQVGDVYFGGFDIGSDSNNPGNLGYVPVTLIQRDEDVSLTASQTHAKPGDLVDFKLSVIANNDAAARDFAFNAKFPAGLQIVPDSVKASNATPGTPTVEDNSFHLAGVQESTRDVQRNYKITSNQDDPLCSLTAANSPEPGYLDLRQLGWRTLEGLEGNYRNNKEYLLSDLMATDQKVTFPFFGNKSFDSIKISPAGVIYFGARNLPHVHMKMPDGYNGLPSPEDMIAPLWIGDNQVTRFDGGYGKYELNAGVTPTYTYSREWLVLEFDNITRSSAPEQLVDFEIFMRMLIDHEPGEYEMLIAYDNLNLVNGDGSIGFKSYVGRMLVDGDIPVDISHGAGFAFNDVDEKLSDKLVLCLDYQGPEQSKFEVNFQAYVSEQAANSVQKVVLENGMQGADTESLSVEVVVAGNLQMAQLPNMQVDENSSISFEVNYADGNKVSNEISLVGEHFSYELSGHESGATVTLTPNADFHGETEVTVMVRDTANMGDSVSSSFLLSVMSDGIEKGCTDSGATNFDPNANQDDGSCKFPPKPEVEEKTETSSGGALGWSMLFLALFGALRQQRRRVVG